MQAVNIANSIPVSIAGINYYFGPLAGNGQSNRRQRFGSVPNAAIDAGNVAVNLHFGAEPVPPVAAVRADTPVYNPNNNAAVHAPQPEPAVEHHLASVLPVPDTADISKGHLAPVTLEGDEEVFKMSISPPKLHISADVKLSDLEREVAPRARAFVRNVKKYFSMVRGGHHDPMRCLYLANALDGAAKTWHDKWANARENYTSEDLLKALLARFAPQFQPREVEARRSLAAGAHRMHPGESVPAYQSRFEALITPISDITDSERLFWFQQGLSGDLVGDCAADLKGCKFTTYDDLVQFALGAEARIVARKQAERLARSAPKFNMLTMQDMDLSDQEEDLPIPESMDPRAASASKGTTQQGALPSMGKGTGRSRHGYKGKGQAPKLQGGISKRGGKAKFNNRKPRDDEMLDKFKCTRLEYNRRKAKKLCLRCASEAHRANDCPALKAEQGASA